jgi:outer membrane autotransporter protein
MRKLRIGQHGSLLVALTSAQGLLATYAHAIPTSETISTAVGSGREISYNFDNLDITSQGSLITSGYAALQVTYEGSLGSLNNAGILSGTNGYSVYNAGTIGTIDNSGTIANPSTTGALYLESGSQTDLINNSGLIGDTNSSNYGYAIYNYGNLNTLNNKANGTITGAIGLYNNGYISSIENAGTISNNSNGQSGDGAIFNIGTIDSIVNTGTITSNYTNGIAGGSVAIRNYGNIGSITNIGTMSSNNFAILTDSSRLNAISEIINSGLISAPQAIYSYNTNRFSAPLQITNSGTIAGDISNYGSTAMTFSGGTQTQGVLTGYAPNSIGYIFTNGQNVTFSSGSLLLNDHIYATGANVLNDAASIQVNAPIIIYGDYHQNSTAALLLGVNNAAVPSDNTATASGFGRLTVNGAATIEQGSRITLVRTGNSYQFATGQRYVVVSANSANTQYNANALHYKAVGYNGAVKGTEYNDGTRSALVVSLEEAPVMPVASVVPGVAVVPVSGTQSQAITSSSKASGSENLANRQGAIAALNGLKQYSGISPQLLELYNASLALSGTSEANRAGEQLSSSQNINASAATGSAVTKAMTVVGNRMNSVRSGQTTGASGVATGDAYDEWAFWGQPFGGFARQDSTRDVSGYKAKFGGLLLGADRAIGDNWRAGAAVNYSNTSVRGTDNLSNDRSTADNYGVIGYAGYTGNPWYLNLSAGVNHQSYDSTRNAEFTGFTGAA